ncbi:AMP-binding protein [Rubripirellula reticaptiva]|uniref:Putative fatty-acid--CoA ligase fadD21 n=1 Tax=Rubripirellula reticaptiva TaxID=2528013 RepID=A0A5C6EL86_9BACT|nr:AMP-binding protein [Rubripirellula reticaptiva]TWU49598.1 putative fatty-acid--CoA ligase fadD21 [Rubripirellula reticaptiva]
MAPPELLAATTFAQWIGKRAELHGDRIAATFLNDQPTAGHPREVSWSYADLWRRSCRVALLLADATNRPVADARITVADAHPPRALLLYPPGIEFLAGFLGCQIAGWIPVPTSYPKPGRSMPRLDSAAADCCPQAILGDQATIDSIDPSKLSPAAGSIHRIVTSGDLPDQANQSWIAPDSLPDSLPNAPDSLALLQYTSGSTSDPKGVMVSHRNLLANLEAIRRGFGIEWQDPSDPNASVATGVFWLPFFHDMGLIGGILAPLYIGGRTVLMSPTSFLQRPIRWLQAISDYDAQFSGAPNFAYQLCVDRISPDQTDNLDLSRWQVAFSGAEPVLARTLQDFGSRFSSSGFSSSAFYPCYGLAEATLLAAGGDGPAEPKPIIVKRDSVRSGKPIITETGRGSEFQKLVSCGTASHESELRIVDPETCIEVSPGTIGEIWLRGTAITAGYWNRDQENAEMFNASIAGDSSSENSSGFYRTGDLGFLHQSELFVTGRRKDLVILRGRNLFPQDIESTTLETIGAGAGRCTAFAIDSGRGEALAIVAELPRHYDDADLPEMVRSIRRAVIDVHEVDPRHVWLVRPATVPVTSSGKVQRHLCRERFDADEIKTRYRYDRASGSEQVPIPLPTISAHPKPDERADILLATQNWMSQWLIARAGVDPIDVALEKPFTDYGLDSMTAVEMSGEIEDWSGVELTPIVAWNYPNTASLSEFIADQIIELACHNST